VKHEIRPLDPGSGEIDTRPWIQASSGKLQAASLTAIV